MRIRLLEQSADAFLDAPIMGHGTGAIRAVFEAGAKQGQDQHRIATSNPHSQLLSVAVQLGLVGVLALAAMWWSHIAVFLRPGFVAGLGLVLVVQHIVSCQFNSHIADFTQGWLYVFGVGILAPEPAKSSRT